MENDLPAGPDLRLLFDEASRTLSVSLAPDPQFPRIDALWLRNRLAAAHYADLQIRPEPIKQLIARYNAGEAVSPIEIAHCVDASLQIMISLDGLSARLTLIPPKGGQPATKADVLALIQGKGIVEGVLVDEIDVQNDAANGMAQWDLLTSEGLEIAAGVYIFYVKSQLTGDEFMGKFAVVK